MGTKLNVCPRCLVRIVLPVDGVGHHNDQGMVIECDSDTGLSDDDRDSIWNNPQDYLGLLVEIRADIITKPEDSDVYSLRFPRFKGFRGFEPGEKI